MGLRGIVIGGVSYIVRLRHRSECVLAPHRHSGWNIAFSSFVRSNVTLFPRCVSARRDTLQPPAFDGDCTAWWGPETAL